MYFGFIIINKKQYYLKLESVKLNYSSLYEGTKLKENKLSTSYNLILFVKKMLFMMFLVLLYNYPFF